MDHFKSWRRTGIAMALYCVAMTASVLLSGIALVGPFSFIVTCIAAWDVGLFVALAWALFARIVVPCVLTLCGDGPFYIFPDAAVVVTVILAGSMVAEVILACLTARLRSVTDEMAMSQSALLHANEELSNALDEVKELRGLLPICAWCKDVRDLSGNWEQIESYLSRHSRAVFTHGLCPKCSNTMAAATSE